MAESTVKELQKLQGYMMGSEIGFLLTITTIVVPLRR
jgi:hypothetical protein